VSRLPVRRNPESHESHSNLRSQCLLLALLGSVRDRRRLSLWGYCGKTLLTLSSSLRDPSPTSRRGVLQRPPGDTSEALTRFARAIRERQLWSIPFAKRTPSKFHQILCNKHTDLKSALSPLPPIGRRQPLVQSSGQHHRLHVGTSRHLADILQAYVPLACAKSRSAQQGHHLPGTGVNQGCMRSLNEEAGAPENLHLCKFSDSIHWPVSPVNTTTRQMIQIDKR